MTLLRDCKIVPIIQLFHLEQIAVGDRDGVLQVFGTKKGDLGFNFKTLPGKEISRLELGGALGMPFS